MTRERELYLRLHTAAVALPLLAVLGACEKSAVDVARDGAAEAGRNDAAAAAVNTAIPLPTVPRPDHAPSYVPGYAVITQDRHLFHASWDGGGAVWADPCPPIHAADAGLPREPRPLGCPATIDMPIRPAMHGTLDEKRTREARDAGAPQACCYEYQSFGNRGRVLTDERGGAVTLGVAFATPCPEGVRSALARAWLRDAAEEQAAAAAFVRAARELAQIGAPQVLVQDTLRAADDEARHARACAAVASGYANGVMEVEAAPSSPARDLGVADVALTTFLEACIPESIAAVACAWASDGCEDARTRRVLARIADDEGSHAALAFRVVRWALSVTGERTGLAERLRAALVGAQQALLSQGMPAGAGPEDRLGAHGRLSASEQRRAAQVVLDQVVAPILAGLCALS